MNIHDLFTIPAALHCRRVERDETGEPVTDDFGREVVDTFDIATTESGAPLLVRYEPARRDEHDDAGEISDDRGRVWMPTNVDVRHVDAITMNGIGRFEVVGAPGRWAGPKHPTNDHLELTVRRTEGSEEHEPEEVGS